MAQYDFGPFHYDPEQRVLFRDGNVVSLAPKAVETLHVLLEGRGRILEKSALIKLLWPDTTVEEIGLARNISILRKAIEDGDGTAYIETIPKRGYRFVAESAPALPQPARWRPSRWIVVAAGLAILSAVVYWQFYVPSKYLIHRPGSASLTVVPFESVTPEADSTAFARGLTDVLVADLSNAGGIEVLSPSTVRRHQRFGVSMGLMGRPLGLDALVEGSVQKVNNQMQVTVRLVDVHTGRIIWAENYDSPQDEIARDVAAQIGTRLAAGRH